MDIIIEWNDYHVKSTQPLSFRNHYSQQNSANIE